MLHSAHRTAILLLAATSACLVLAGVARAQVADDGRAPRYLSWANRPADTTPGDVLAARVRTRDGMIPRRVAPSEAIQRPMLQTAPVPVPVSRGLTPASAWLGPRTVPAYATGSPDPTGLTGPTDVVPGPSSSAPRPADLPVVETAEVTDPMAPRRDAPIFRLQPQGPADSPQGPSAEATPVPGSVPGSGPSASPGQQGARYYSVHRDAGRQPDPTVMPEPVFFDSVTLDLAEPPATEPVLRDAQGRRRAVANADPSLP